VTHCLRSRSVVFGSMNMRSLSPLKLDTLLTEFYDNKVDDMLLCETWHDVDSVAIRRLRADGFMVVERAHHRSQRAEKSLGVNHGGVAIVAAAGIHLSAIDIVFQNSTFEYTAGRVQSGTSSCIVVAVYRPGSSVVTSSFFEELANLLERLSTFANALVLAGDVNNQLERATDANTIDFHETTAGHWFTQHVTSATHDAGGILDVLCTHDDMPTPTVSVLDTGLSDHRLLLWSTSLVRPPPVYVKSTRRPWRSFDLSKFQNDLRASDLCDARKCQDLDGDSLIQLYDDTITALLDHQVPYETKSCRRRPSNVWYDANCQEAK